MPRSVRLLFAVLTVLLTAPVAAHAATTTTTLTYGPIRVGGYETVDTHKRVPAPDVDGSIVQMWGRVVDADGRRVPQTRVMLHHALWVNEGRFDGDRRRTYCDDRPREPFYGTAEEDSELNLPPGYGYPVRKGDRWRLRYMLMNHRVKAETVYVSYTVTTTDEPTTPVTPHWISVACNRDRIYNVPGGGAPGSEHTASTTWTPPATGRMVAMLGHVHGGAKRLTLSDPSCADRVLASMRAQYGGPDDPIYRVSPMLHEPSPRSVAQLTSATGWPLQAGRAIRLDSVYEDSRPHVKVMGIAHIYVAEGPPPPPPEGADPAAIPEPCPALPPDVVVLRRSYPGAPGREEPPVVRQDISKRGPGGRGVPVTNVGGPAQRVPAGPVRVDLRDYAFGIRHLSIASGTEVTYRFRDPDRHDVSWVDGPRGFASEYSRRGGRFRTRFTEPGKYKVYCSLHPVLMSQVVDVRGPRVGAPASADPSLVGPPLPPDPNVPQA